MSIKEIEYEIIQEFELFDDWMQKYEHIIELGKELPLIAKEYKTENYLIKGCQSQVWLYAEFDNNQKINLTADSDAIITKGLIALIVRVFNKQSVQEILNANMDFINVIGLTEHLSPTRANGLLSMIKQIKTIAHQQMLKISNS